MARLLGRERYSPVEVRPGRTPAPSRPLIPYTTRRDMTDGGGKAFDGVATPQGVAQPNPVGMRKPVGGE